ncbi:telomere repeats-binding bouquet formation protein 2 [Pogona vitticeps]
MFQGCSAWFSQSVCPDLCSLWVAEGGRITTQKAADYLFSSDASHPDTKRIHKSLDYIEDRITVFHSSYLTAIANSEMKHPAVPLGHFLLPPASLHQGYVVVFTLGVGNFLVCFGFAFSAEIRDKIGCFIWDQISNTPKLQSGQPEVNSRIEEEDKTSKEGLERSEDSHAPRALETKKQLYIPLQDYPASNMLTGYASAKELKKFLGEIRDFIPGFSGDLAYWIPNDTNIFSQGKTMPKWK